MTIVRTATSHTRHTQVPAEVGVSILRRPAHIIVRLCGDLVFSTAPALRECLLGILRPGMRLLIIDLSGVRSCDAAGSALLIGTRRRATRLGIALRLTAPRPGVAEQLRITGLDRVLSLHATLTDALARPISQVQRGHRRRLHRAGSDERTSKGD